MNRRAFLATSVVSVFAATAQGKGANLVVHVNYSGQGAVDASHKLYVVLWDSPDFVKDNSGTMMPFAVKGVISKSTTVRFDGVQKNPVSLSLAYDPTGKWDARSEPPVGASLGLYAKGEPGTPSPIQLESGKTTTVHVTLDDSYKKPKADSQ